MADSAESKVYTRGGLPPGCPPPEAAPTNGRFFRLRDPEGVRVWLSALEDYGETRAMSHPGATPCTIRGLSLSADAEELRELQRVAKKFATWTLCGFDLTKDMGEVHNNHDSHHAWWPLDGATLPPEGFEEEGDQ